MSCYVWWILAVLCFVCMTFVSQYHILRHHMFCQCQIKFRVNNTSYSAGGQFIVGFPEAPNENLMKTPKKCTTQVTYHLHLAYLEGQLPWPHRHVIAGPKSSIMYRTLLVLTSHFERGYHEGFRGPTCRTSRQRGPGTSLDKICFWVLFSTVLMKKHAYMSCYVWCILTVLCLFHVRPSDFCSLYKVRHVMGALIMTSIEHMEKVYDSSGNRTRALSHGTESSL